MLVAVTGSTGLIGSALVPSLVAEGHEVLRFTRSPSPGPGAARWDPAGGTIDSEALSKADAVAHLAGRSIAALRWTPKVRREILESRTRGTRLLAETMASLPDGPRVLVSASGINFYGDRGDEVLTETSPSGQGFLAEVCRQWEGAAGPARAAGIRTVHVRTGFVQPPRPTRPPTPSSPPRSPRSSGGPPSSPCRASVPGSWSARWPTSCCSTALACTRPPPRRAATPSSTPTSKRPCATCSHAHDVGQVALSRRWVPHPPVPQRKSRERVATPVWSGWICSAITLVTPSARSRRPRTSRAVAARATRR